MFFGKKDHGEKRSYTHRDEFSVSNTGRPRRTGRADQEAEVLAIVADALAAASVEVRHLADDLERQSQTIVEADGFDAMVTGG